ncbi:MAG: phage antirepressor N-terminal domain-containing protein [Burkholderiales bacterium]|nr:phage antirepressor N-terminal domain-containing protein [Burkholderiales bacterium]
MANALTPVEFHGATLSATLIDGMPFVALKPICDAIGIDWEGQRVRIQGHPVLNSVACVTKATGTDGKQYNMLMLPLNKLNGWLFGVSVRRVRPELRERLTRYQAECFDVLARHFNAAPAAPALPALSGQAQAIDTLLSIAAFHAAQSTGVQVQSAVFKAVRAGGNDWKHGRWMVSFITDSQIAVPAMVDKLGADEFVTSVRRLASTIHAGRMPAQDVEVLFEACARSKFKDACANTNRGLRARSRGQDQVRHELV